MRYMKLCVAAISGCILLYAKDTSGQSTPVQKDSSQTKSTSTVKSFGEFFKEPVLSDTGMFITHQSGSGTYFEIPDSLLKKDMLMVSTRVAMSGGDIEQAVAGERAQPGLMLRWERSPDGKSVFLRKVTSRNSIRFSGKDTAFGRAVALQTLDPILMAFPVKVMNENGNNAIIDIKPLFVADLKEITPFSQDPLKKMLGLPDTRKYRLAEDRSYLISARPYEKNVEVKSLLTYLEGENIYTMEVNRSMILLPETPMMPRFADNRVGYFAQTYSDFNESSAVEEKYFISRWRLEHHPKDVGAVRKGKPRPPIKPIVFYIDASTPVKWREYIKKGVEDWKPAFEAAGFSDAIEARDVPLNDSTFQAEDIRYSVIRYTASQIPNAKGPSVTDPRSGEIMESDIIIYHNILKLLAEWRFAQTAANDPNARTLQLSDEMMGEAIRYVTAHEVGHSLGLRHNMGASYAFPVDSLRSASFTKKYGTTPSIMDYARNNYVAQPGDKGVKLTPPLLGVYDVHAIRWGYAPITDAKTSSDEIKTLNEWIRKHENDPRYRFAEGDINGSDPSSLRESLGDDVVKASEYGVKNIRYIMGHIPEWFNEPGESYENMQKAIAAALKQYERYFGHVGTVVGGTYQYYPVQGQQQPMYAYTSRKDQQRAVAFILQQYRELPLWLGENFPPQLNITEINGIAERIVPVSTYIERLYKGTFQAQLLNNGVLAYLIDNELKLGDKAYRVSDLFGDIRGALFSDSSADHYVKVLQSMYVERLLTMSNLRQGLVSGKSGFSSAGNEHTGICSMEHVHDESGNSLYFQFMDMKADDKKHTIETMVFDELMNLEKLMKEKVKTNNGGNSHYLRLLKRIDLMAGLD